MLLNIVGVNGADKYNDMTVFLYTHKSAAELVLHIRSKNDEDKVSNGSIPLATI